MRYLLDVNALVACEHARSPHHAVFHAWAARAGARNLMTCGISELGFMRVSMQVFGYSLEQSHASLKALRPQFGGFIGTYPAPNLARWADSASRTTDGYLMQIASEAGVQLATFDRGIPGAVLIQ